jgi:hypothetical protein
MNHDPKVASMVQRMHAMTVASNVTIAQAASAHFNCLGMLALTDANGDEKQAAEILRKAMEQLIAFVHEPTSRTPLQLVGNVIEKIGGGKDH